MKKSYANQNAPVFVDSVIILFKYFLCSQKLDFKTMNDDFALPKVLH